MLKPKYISKIIISLLFTLFLVVNKGIGQTYKTFEETFEAFKSYSKTKGFKAVEDMYDHCKHIIRATLIKTNEEYENNLNRTFIELIWDYRYVGCYIGWDKYTVSAKVSGYIKKSNRDQYIFVFKEIEVFNWDPDTSDFKTQCKNLILLS